MNRAEQIATELNTSLLQEQKVKGYKNLFRFDDADGWRWYAQSKEHFDKGDCYISVTRVLETVVHDKLKGWWQNNSKNAIAKKTTETADLGTRIHELIRLDLCGEKYEVSEDVKDAFNQWLRLKAEHNISAYSTEMFVHSDLHGFAGACDIQGYFDGNKCVMDVKTGSYSIKAGWQLAAYRQAIFENTGELIGMVGLHIKRDGSIGQPYKYEHYDFCLQAFLSTLFCFRALYFSKLKKMNWRFLK